MSFGISSSVYPTASSAAILAIGNPVAFEARADERETRGFISIRTWRPVRGSTANWMFEPPVSTPIARMHASAASRIRWYSRSDSVITGATVIESPVCTPIGSTFSIEQITTALSAPSRITSSSNSFHPATDSSTRISVTGLAARLRLATRSSSARVRANPLPPPPRVNEGRTMSGYPSSSPSSSARSSERAVPARGVSSPARPIVSLKPLRSSARWIASSPAPISPTPSRSRSPDSASATATFSAVWPPSVGSSTSGRSRSITSRTDAGVSGSMYVRSANSGSVMIVAGLEFTSETWNPSRRSTLQAWVPE
jgi:hypothetical protein